MGGVEEGKWVKTGTGRGRGWEGERVCVRESVEQSINQGRNRKVTIPLRNAATAAVAAATQGGTEVHTHHTHTHTHVHEIVLCRGRESSGRDEFTAWLQVQGGITDLQGMYTESGEGDGLSDGKGQAEKGAAAREEERARGGGRGGRGEERNGGRAGAEGRAEGDL